MAEGRMLKKKISLNEALADLDNDTHRLLFTWAIPHLDIEGRMSGSPRVFKATVVPLLDHLTPAKISAFFKDAHNKRLIIHYKIDGEWWIEYPKFKENQNLRESRESPSKIPPPPDNSGTTPGVLPEPSEHTPAEVNRREVNRREENTSAHPKTDAPHTYIFSSQFFDIDQTYFDRLQADYPGLDPPKLLSEIKKAADWCEDNPKKFKRKSNGKRANVKTFLRNWLSKVEINREYGAGGVDEWLKQTSANG